MCDERLNFIKLFPQKNKSQQFANFPQTQKIYGLSIVTNGHQKSRPMI